MPGLSRRRTGRGLSSVRNGLAVGVTSALALAVSVRPAVSFTEFEPGYAAPGSVGELVLFLEPQRPGSRLELAPGAPGVVTATTTVASTSTAPPTSTPSSTNDDPSGGAVGMRNTNRLRRKRRKRVINNQ